MRLERKTALRGLVGAAAGALLALGTATTAFAADKYVLEEVEETPVEFGTGWYIRGDIGANFGSDHRDSKVTLNGTDMNDDLSTTFSFRVGAGLRLAPKLRVDATFDYHSRFENTRDGAIIGGCRGEQQTQTIDATTSLLVTVTQATTIVDCRTRDSDGYDSQDLMLNAYYDLAQRGAFMPYVGVGLGATRLNYTSSRGAVVCNPLSDQRCADVGYGLAGEYGEEDRQDGNVNNGTSYHLAGAVTLGVGYQVAKNLTLDASYQLTKTMEDPLFGGSNGYDAVAADSLRHSLRVGLRYELW